MLQITATSLRRMARDRSTLFFTVLFPLAIIFIIGLAIAADDGGAPVGVMGGRDGPMAAELRDRIAGTNLYEITEYDDRGELARAVRRGTIHAGVVIADGYDDSVRAGTPVSVEFVVDRTRGVPQVLRQVVAGRAADHTTAWDAGRFATTHAGGDVETNAGLAAQVASSGQTLGVTSEVIGAAVAPVDSSDNLPDGFAYTAPSNLVLFVFITSLAAAALVVESRRLGVSRRVFAGPVTAWQIVGGEGLARFVIAAGQALIILAAGALVFGVNWGSPVGAAAIVIAFSLVASAAAMILGTILRTEEQAFSAGLPIGIALGMLGGCMWPLEIVPEPMRAFGHAFPHAWAMDGFIALIGRGAGMADVLPNVLVLLGFAAALLPLAALRLRRAIVA